MKHTAQNLTSAQIEFLHKVMEGGNQQVSNTLELLTGQTLDQHSVHIKVVSATDVINLLDLSTEPLTTVSASIHGDVEGDFLFLQTKRDSQTLGGVMRSPLTGVSPHTLDEATAYMTPDWLVHQRRDAMDSKGSDAQMLDVITEMGNILFGGYLTALYSSCKLAVYQDVPDPAVMDGLHAILRKALSRNSEETNIAFVIEIDYVIANNKLKAWLLMLPLMDGLRAMLDNMDTAPGA